MVRPCISERAGVRILRSAFRRRFCLPKGDGAREMRWNLVSVLRCSSLNNAAHLCAPRAIVARRAVIGRCFTLLDRCPGGVRSFAFRLRYAPAVRALRCSPAGFHASLWVPPRQEEESGALHARSRPSLLNCSASNENSHARDGGMIRAFEPGRIGARFST